MRANLFWAGRRMLPAIILATMAMPSAWGQANTDRKQEVDMALDQYGAAKTADQRAAVIDYLRHLDGKLVAGAIVDHIIASRTGDEATAYNRLVEAIAPDGCTAVVDRLSITDGPVAKGKLVVALRHCASLESIRVLAGCLDDKRPVRFEAHGPIPRRVCDLAYDELFLKVRGDPHYGLDPGPHMKGIITEKVPVKARDALIAKLKANLAKHPVPSPPPVPSPTPEPVKPGTASITLL